MLWARHTSIFNDVSDPKRKGCKNDENIKYKINIKKIIIKGYLFIYRTQGMSMTIEDVDAGKQGSKNNNNRNMPFPSTFLCCHA